MVDDDRKSNNIFRFVLCVSLAERFAIATGMR